MGNRKHKQSINVNAGYIQVDTHAYPDGIYILKLTNSENDVTQKVLIVN